MAIKLIFKWKVCKKTRFETEAESYLEMDYWESYRAGLTKWTSLAFVAPAFQVTAHWAELTTEVFSIKIVFRAVERKHGTQKGENSEHNLKQWKKKIQSLLIVTNVGMNETIRAWENNVLPLQQKVGKYA